MFIGEKPEIIAAYLPDWPYYIIVFMILSFVSLHVLYFVSNFNYSKLKYRFDELKLLTAKAKLKQPEEVAKELVKGIRNKKINIHIGSSGWINWLKRHLPKLYFGFIDRDLKKTRQKLSKVSRTKHKRPLNV